MEDSRMALAATMVALLAPVAYPNTDTAERYSALWHSAHHRCGRCAGRNIRRYGIRHTNGRLERASYEQMVRSSHQLRRLTAPPPRPRGLLRRLAVPPPQAPAGVSSSTVRARLPDCTWRPESGGDYGAYNGSSGARGRYQVIPSTHAAICPDLGWSPSEQEICAARIWAQQGAGAWVNC